MRDIYLIANCKFSNMDIIILFLVTNFLSFPPLPTRAPFHPPFARLSSASSRSKYSIFISYRPLYRAKKKDYRLYHTRAHTYAHTCSHSLSCQPIY